MTNTGLGSMHKLCYDLGSVHEKYSKLDQQLYTTCLSKSQVIRTFTKVYNSESTGQTWSSNPIGK